VVLFAADPRLNVLVITGGHAFEREPFIKLFSDNNALTFTAAEHAKGTASVWDRDDLARFDVIALYDMPMAITEVQKKALLSTFERGTGLVVLHHALVSYQDWPDYERLIGGRYPKPPNGQPQVTETVGYEHDVEIPIVVVDKAHPITAGLGDFIIHDEIYWGFRVGADVHPLLTTTQPKSGKPLMWTRMEGKSRIVYLQLGHDHQAWENANYATLLARSLQWAAGK
jgi:type 1 glutamine amidotransferase